jgi:hypothetical protein
LNNWDAALTLLSDCPLNILAATTNGEKNCSTELLHARTYGNYFPQYALSLYLQEKKNVMQ